MIFFHMSMNQCVKLGSSTICKCLTIPWIFRFTFSSLFCPLCRDEYVYRINKVCFLTYIKDSFGLKLICEFLAFIYIILLLFFMSFVLRNDSLLCVVSRCPIEVVVATQKRNFRNVAIFCSSIFFIIIYILNIIFSLNVISQNVDSQSLY